jgi:hypothetical protein
VECEWLLRWLFDAGPIASGDMGLRGLNWVELMAWRTATDADASPREMRLLRRLSESYAAAYRDSQDADHKGYWIGDEVAEAQIAQVERADQSIGMIFGALAQRSNPGA